MESTWDAFKWKKLKLGKFKIIRLIIVIFHMCTLIYINILVQKIKIEKMFKYASMENLIFCNPKKLWYALGATNSKPNNMKNQSNCQKKLKLL
jgi:hypothetical protein